jgi:hypothetical protein
MWVSGGKLLVLKQESIGELALALVTGESLPPSAEKCHFSGSLKEASGAARAGTIDRSLHFNAFFYFIVLN